MRPPSPIAVPLVSRILPSDICRIQKRGNTVRMDTTLVDFQDMKWERGDITFLFQGDCQPGKMLAILDNAQKVYQMVQYPVSGAGRRFYVQDAYAS